MGMDLTSQHAENLYRNLSGFNLELDKVVRDGNCFFKSVARQISAYLKGDNRQRNILDHLGLESARKKPLQNLDTFLLTR